MQTTTHRKQRVSGNTHSFLTTFSKGAAPNTLKTGLGLEGEIQRTIACCPTRVVYSSSVARSFLNKRTKREITWHRHKISCDLRQFILIRYVFFYLNCEKGVCEV